MNYAEHDIGVPKSVALEAPPQPSRSWTISHKDITAIAILIDALIIFSTSILSGIAYHIITIGHFGDISQYGGAAFLVSVLFIAVANSRDLYTVRELLNLKSQIIQVATRWFGVLLFITAVGFTLKVGDHFSRGATFSFVIFGFAALVGARIGWRIFLANRLAVHKFYGRKVVLIAENSAVVDANLVETLTRHGLQLVKQFVLPSNHNSAQRRKDVVAQAIAAVRGSDIEEIIVGANPDRWPELKSLMAELRTLPLPVNFVPVGPLSELFGLATHTIGDTTTIEVHRGPRTPWEQSVKRTVDIVFAGLALVLFLPLMVITAIAIKLDSPGPVVFRQRRCGFNGKPFQILKFRSMTVLEDGNSIIPAQPKDARVTRLGNLLRRTSIDELPQLLNVIRGSMSIVGPRPHAMAHDYKFDKLVGNYAFRQHVKPGLTGWAQVHGYRGQLRTVSDIEERVKYDLWYIDNWSIAIDFKIMLMTVIEVMRGENAY